MTKPLVVIPGVERPLSFSALTVALYEDGEDKPFMKFFSGLVNEVRESGHFNLTAVARLAYYGVVSTYQQHSEAPPNDVTVLRILEILLEQDNFDLVTKIVNSMAEALPRAKNAESPKEETTEPELGQK